MSPDSFGAGFAGGAGAAVAAGLGVAGGAEFGLDATVELLQPLTVIATVAAKISHACFRFVIAAFFLRALLRELPRQPGPHFLPYPPERRAQNHVAHWIPSALEPPAFGANSGAPHHSITSARARIVENRPHQKILVAGLRLCFGADPVDRTLERSRRKCVQFQRD